MTTSSVVLYFKHDLNKESVGMFFTVLCFILYSILLFLLLKDEIEIKKNKEVKKDEF